MINLALIAAIFSPFLIDISHLLVIKKTASRSLFLGLLFAGMFGSLGFLPLSTYSLIKILFIASLCISVATDFSYYLISRYVTLYLIPLIWIGIYFHKIPLSFYESIEGTFLSFVFLWSIKQLFFLLKKQEGLGQGDIDMIAYIAAFTGILGAWCTLMYACLLSLIYIAGNILFTHTYHKQIPFGVFLGIGCWIHILYPHAYLTFFSIY